LFVVTIESVLNESHVSLFALRNGMPIHWASSSHGAEGNILAAMCSSPPFHEMGELFVVTIESVLNESHVSLFALRNGMPIHWASSS
ncbi:hypothetical protein ACLXAR_28540, partial [Escherichia coli]